MGATYVPVGAHFVPAIWGTAGPRKWDDGCQFRLNVFGRGWEGYAREVAGL
jgi:hypothetical protein